jgi:hypothetical protein
LPTKGVAFAVGVEVVDDRRFDALVAISRPALREAVSHQEGNETSFEL